AIEGQMLFHIFYHSPQPFAPMIARTFIVDIAKGSFNRAGLGAVGRQEEQRKARVRRQPQLDRLRFVNLVVVHNYREVGELSGRIRLVKSCEQVQEQAMRLTPPYPMDDRPRAHIQGSRQVAFLVSPRGQDFHLGSFGHPLVADFGQQMDIQLVGKEQRCRGGQVSKHETDPGQLLHALGVVIFGGQLGALPDPTEVVQPAAQRLGGDLYAPARLDLQGQRGTAPARATPPTCTGHGLKDRQHGALQARSQYPQPRAAGIFLTWVVKRQRARPVRLHHPINARTRTEEHGGNLAGGAARGTQQQQVQGQQVPIAGPAQFCQHAGLLSHWNIYYRRFRHSRTSMIARSVWQPSIYERVRLCANLLCFDLVRNFTVFQQVDGKTRKVVARYQQFRAIHKAVARLQDGRTRAQGADRDERGGIIWHTQGSGKSLSMVFLVRKMRMMPRLNRFKVVLVTDRTDLESQLLETTRLSGETLRPKDYD